MVKKSIKSLEEKFEKVLPGFPKNFDTFLYHTFNREHLKSSFFKEKNKNSTVARNLQKFTHIWIQTKQYKSWPNPITKFNSLKIPNYFVFILTCVNFFRFCATMDFWLHSLKKWTLEEKIYFPEKNRGVFVA